MKWLVGIFVLVAVLELVRKIRDWRRGLP